GAIDEAQALAQAAAAVGAAIEDPLFHGALALMQARVGIAGGEAAAAEALLVRELPRLSALPERGPMIRALELLAELAEGRGDDAGALAYLRRRLAHSRRGDAEEVRARARNLQVSMAIAAAEREAQ